VPKFQDGIIITVEVMGGQVHAIGKAIRSLFADPVTNNISGSNSNSIITPGVLKEISNLKVHITKGCLSDIPAQFGTSKNENLHKVLNSRFSGNHLGVELAIALLAVFFTIGINRMENTVHLIFFSI